MKRGSFRRALPLALLLIAVPALIAEASPIHPLTANHTDLDLGPLSSLPHAAPQLALERLFPSSAASDSALAFPLYSVTGNPARALELPGVFTRPPHAHAPGPGHETERVLEILRGLDGEHSAAGAHAKTLGAGGAIELGIAPRYAVSNSLPDTSNPLIPIPEPASVTLLALGSAMLMRRKIHV
ncbi:MAG: hypothetical protein KF886_03255 [Candidatus Hydrogenedentes bacterium]|nr:hypothetical protein [Candidatus Hydrogenedentota bacterium]